MSIRVKLESDGKFLVSGLIANTAIVMTAEQVNELFEEVYRVLFPTGRELLEFQFERDALGMLLSREGYTANAERARKVSLWTLQGCR